MNARSRCRRPDSPRAALLARTAEAQSHLRGKVVSDASIHSARKSIKMARAMLRLMRGVLPESAFRRQNRTLRNAARPLNVTRDAKVLVDALDRLTRKNEAIDESAIQEFRRALLASRLRARRSAMKSGNRVPRSRTLLRGAHRTTSRWRHDADTWPELRAGLERTHARGRRALAAARSKPSAENLHEWRKQVKYLWHQLQFLQPMRPGQIEKLARRTHTLSDHLGDDHDLAVLREQVLAHEDAFESARALHALLAAIDGSREALQKKVFRLGERLYRENSARFTGRLTG